MDAYSHFSPGGAAEAFFLVSSSPGSDFSGAAEEVLARLESAVAAAGSSLANAMMTRVYLRGGKRAREALYGTRLYREISRGAVSIVGQDPLESGPIALFSRHVFSAHAGARMTPLGGVAGSAPVGAHLRGNYSHLWLAQPPLIPEEEDIEVRTTGCLEAWQRVLDACGMNWAEHVLRTWFFIDDIDRNYLGMVGSRLEFFLEQGLTPHHRFPASTGIGARGTGEDPGLTAELLAGKGFSEGQIRVMRDENHMPPAMSYGVSFERGITAVFGDRIHCHISGTASIGRRGEILHPGDLVRQTEQALENVGGLLATEGLALPDLAYLLVYLRDAASAPQVSAVLKRGLPGNVPSLILEGAVCRPGWLVEIEGLAIKAQPGPFKNFP